MPYAYHIKQLRCGQLFKFNGPNYYKARLHKGILAGSCTLLVLDHSPLHADIVDCNGVLTNKPSEDGR